MIAGELRVGVGQRSFAPGRLPPFGEPHALPPRARSSSTTAFREPLPLPAGPISAACRRWPLTSCASEIAKRWPSRSSTFSTAKPSQELRVTPAAVSPAAGPRSGRRSGAGGIPQDRSPRTSMGAPVGRDRGGQGSRNGFQLVGGAKHALRCGQRFGRKPADHQLHRQYDGSRRSYARSCSRTCTCTRCCRLARTNRPKLPARNPSPGWWKFETMVSGALVRDRGRHLASASSTSTTTGDF